MALEHNAPLSKELSPIEMAAYTLVKLIQQRERAGEGAVDKFEAYLFADEQVAWHDLTAAIAGWEVLYG